MVAPHSVNRAKQKSWQTVVFSGNGRSVARCGTSADCGFNLAETETYKSGKISPCRNRAQHSGGYGCRHSFCRYALARLQCNLGRRNGFVNRHSNSKFSRRCNSQPARTCTGKKQRKSLFDWNFERCCRTDFCGADPFDVRHNLACNAISFGFCGRCNAVCGG